jgi:hypothetical protein
MRKLTPTVLLLLIGTVSRATCPTPTVSYSWSYGSPVSYSFPSHSTPPCWSPVSITGSGIDGNINSAFDQWTYADQNQNTSNVTFYLSTGGTPFTVDARTVVIPADCGTTVAAQTSMAVYTGTDVLAIANTTFYFGSTSTFGYANWDQGASNFHTAVQKVMAHEIGHTMGLYDQPVGGGTCGGQTAGQSVMNLDCGTNDSANNMPAPMVGLPSCDNASI